MKEAFDSEEKQITLKGVIRVADARLCKCCGLRIVSAKKDVISVFRYLDSAFSNFIKKVIFCNIRPAAFMLINLMCLLFTIKVSGSQYRNIEMMLSRYLLKSKEFSLKSKPG
ncbi:hypothetical protein wOo_09930 [Wolbachia endosymbiont of Onchocerca ochengi]|uniref:hypothetical protein n=1 Tax=unclassified Wolbachia TaxID=2640676 RepID=UPI00026DA829|nr:MULTISPECIES: hypothetical protein [unclassified Wolbachia]CCF78476.1 hypothetical protein wOo_09930 [Wolbachia endosymbiont of Onchocerca ochengi]